MRIDRTGSGSPQGPSPTTHVAQEGESLQSIAQNYGLAKEALAKANTLPPDAAIQVGQELVIPGAQQFGKERVPLGVGDIQDSFEIGASAKAFAEGAVASIKAFAEGAVAKAFAEGAVAKAFAEGAVAKAFAEGAVAKAFAEGAVAKAFAEGAVAKAFAEGAVAKAFAEGVGAKTNFIEGAAAKAFVEGSFQNYSIQQGDTINSVAARFGITAEELAQFNNVAADAGLQAGMELKVPTK